MSAPAAALEAALADGGDGLPPPPPPPPKRSPNGGGGGGVDVAHVRLLERELAAAKTRELEAHGELTWAARQIDALRDALTGWVGASTDALQSIALAAGRVQSSGELHALQRAVDDQAALLRLTAQSYDARLRELGVDIDTAAVAAPGFSPAPGGDGGAAAVAAAMPTSVPELQALARGLRAELAATQARADAERQRAVLSHQEGLSTLAITLKLDLQAERQRAAAAEAELATLRRQAQAMAATMTLPGAHGLYGGGDGAGSSYASTTPLSAHAAHSQQLQAERDQLAVDLAAVTATLQQLLGERNSAGDDDYASGGSRAWTPAAAAQSSHYRVRPSWGGADRPPLPATPLAGGAAYGGRPSAAVSALLLRVSDAVAAAQQSRFSDPAAPAGTPRSSSASPRAAYLVATLGGGTHRHSATLGSTGGAAGGLMSSSLADRPPWRSVASAAEYQRLAASLQDVDVHIAGMVAGVSAVRRALDAEPAKRPPPASAAAPQTPAGAPTPASGDPAGALAQQQLAVQLQQLHHQLAVEQEVRESLSQQLQAALADRAVAADAMRRVEALESRASSRADAADALADQLAQARLDASLAREQLQRAEHRLAAQELQLAAAASASGLNSTSTAAALDAAEAAAAMARADASLLRQQLSTAQAAAASTHTQLAGAEHEAAALSVSLAQERARAADLAGALDASRAEAARMQAQLQGLRDEVRTVAAAVAAAASAEAHQAAVTAQQQQPPAPPAAAVPRHDHDEALAAVSELAARLGEANAAVAQLQAERATSQDASAALQARCADADARSAQLAAALDDAYRRGEETAAALASTRHTLTELTGALEELRASLEAERAAHGATRAEAADLLATLQAERRLADLGAAEADAAVVAARLAAGDAVAREAEANARVGVLQLDVAMAQAAGAAGGGGGNGAPAGATAPSPAVRVQVQELVAARQRADALAAEVARLSAELGAAAAALSYARRRAAEAEATRDGDVADAVEAVRTDVAAALTRAADGAASFDEELVASPRRLEAEVRALLMLPRRGAGEGAPGLASELQAAAVVLRSLELQKATLARELAQAHRTVEALQAEAVAAARAAAAAGSRSRAGSVAAPAAGVAAAIGGRDDGEDDGADGEDDGADDYRHYPALPRSAPHTPAGSSSRFGSSSASSSRFYHSGVSGGGGGGIADVSGPRWLRTPGRLDASALSVGGSGEGNRAAPSLPSLPPVGGGGGGGSGSMPPQLGASSTASSPKRSGGGGGAGLAATLRDGSDEPHTAVSDAPTERRLGLAERQLRTAAPLTASRRPSYASSSTAGGGGGGGGVEDDASFVAAVLAPAPPALNASSMASAARAAVRPGAPASGLAALPAYSRPPYSGVPTVTVDLAASSASSLYRSSQVSRPPALGGGGAPRGQYLR